jgi:hypothetical protein
MTGQETVLAIEERIGSLDALRQDHASAMECRDLEEGIKQSLRDVEELYSIDEAVRSLLYTNPEHQAGPLLDKVKALLEDAFSKMATLVVLALEKQREGFDVAGFQRLLKASVDLYHALLPNAEFFKDLDMTDAAQAALNDYLEGKTEPMDSDDP